MIVERKGVIVNLETDDTDLVDDIVLLFVTVLSLSSNISTFFSICSFRIHRVAASKIRAVHSGRNQYMIRNTGSGDEITNCNFHYEGTA